MEAIAKGRYLKGSPQKARLVIDLIRGKNVQEALAILRFTNKRAAKPIEKVLLSAVANAREKNATADVDQFIVERAVVDLGPTKWRRRVRPAPMANSAPLRPPGNPSSPFPAALLRSSSWRSLMMCSNSSSVTWMVLFPSVMRVPRSRIA